jgi:DNA replication and repair protein RecF
VILRQVWTRSFRNLADPRVGLSERTTVLFGPNGQGKTNFLEACLQRIGAHEPARVNGEFELAGGAREVEVEISAQGRVARVDQKRVADPDELFGGLATVAFTPDDLAVVKGGPEGRRKLLDRAVQNRHPAHLADARDYLKALRSRNQLLRQGADDALVESFDEPLARLGARLRSRREELLREMTPHAENAFAEVARGEAPLRLLHLAAGRDADHLANGGEDLEARLLAALRRRLPKDRERGYTSVGPHADDLSIHLGDLQARLYASQGQARAVVLALKIGEIENLRRAQGRAPLLLLDDVSSELDPQRSAFLMAYLSGLQGQVILTTTDPRIVAQGLPREALFYAVARGSIGPSSEAAGGP